MGTVSTRPFGVVTGGSSGIGKELARELVKHGWDVMIVAENASIFEAARELADDGATVIPLQIDLTERDGVDRLYQAIKDTARPLEAVALNAGIGVNGRFIETSVDDEVKSIELNCTSVVKLTKRVLPDMVARGRGHLLITSSIAATMPATYMAVYGATKAFDLQFAEALREELKDTGVTVTALQPGPTDTEFFAKAHMGDTRVGAGKKDDPALVAHQAFEAMMKGKDKVLAGSWKSRLLGFLNEVLPEPAKAKSHGKMAEPGSAKR